MTGLMSTESKGRTRNLGSNSELDGDSDWIGATEYRNTFFGPPPPPVEYGECSEVRIQKLSALSP